MPPETAAPAGAAPPAPRSDRRRAAVLATLVAGPVTVALVLIAVLVGDPADVPAPGLSPTAAPTARVLPPVRVAPPPALGTAAQRSCRELIGTLPTELGDRPGRPVDSPSPYVAAWGDPAVTLRCGVARPPTFIGTAELQLISGVAWFAERRGATTAWTVVDRPVYVEVLAPADEASSAVARLSTAVTRALRPQPVDPAD